MSFLLGLFFFFLKPLLRNRRDASRRQATTCHCTTCCSRLSNELPSTTSFCKSSGERRPRQSTTIRLPRSKRYCEKRSFFSFCFSHRKKNKYISFCQRSRTRRSTLASCSMCRHRSRVLPVFSRTAASLCSRTSASRLSLTRRARSLKGRRFVHSLPLSLSRTIGNSLSVVRSNDCFCSQTSSYSPNRFVRVPICSAACRLPPPRRTRRRQSKASSRPQRTGRAAIR